MINTGNRRIFFILFAIFLLGSFIRFYHLGEKSLWTDELVTIDNAVNLNSLGTFFAHTRSDDLPKFYSALLKLWMYVGSSEAVLRSLSVIFGCLSILVVYALSGLFFDKKTSLLAAFLTAISPFLLLYDREIRMYSLFSLLSLLSTYCFIRMLRNNEKHMWFFYAIVNVLNIYTHYYAFLIVGVQWLYLIICNKSYRHIAWRWVTVNAILLLFFSIKIPAFISDVAFFAPWVVPRERFPFVFGKEFVEFFYIFFSFSVGQTILPWNPFALIIALTVLICLIVAIRKGNLLASRDMLYLVMLVFIPIVIGLVFRISLPRYFIFVAPIYFIFIARGLSSFSKRTMIAGIIILTLGMGYGLSNYYGNRQFHFMGTVDPWREIAQYLKQNVAENDTVYIVGLGTVPLKHYYGDKFKGLDGKSLVEKFKKGNNANEKKVWIVYTYQEEYNDFVKAQDMILDQYTLIEEKKWVNDPDYRLKKKLFKKEFAPYRVIAQHFVIKNQQDRYKERVKYGHGIL